MRLAKFEYLAPESVAEACAILAERGEEAAIIAGGTDLLVRMKQRLVCPRFLVSLKKVEELRKVRLDSDGLCIGAMVRLGDIQRSSLVRQHAPILVQAAESVGATQLQNMGTIGGNICLEARCWYYNQSHFWRQSREVCLKAGGSVCHMAKGSKRCYAVYSGDMAAALLALGAKVRLVRAAGERIAPLEHLFVDDGQRPLRLQSGELLAEVIIPLGSDRRSVYLKFRRREAIDFPIVGVGAMVEWDGELCRALTIGVTGVSSAPFLVRDIDDVCKGNRLTGEVIGAIAEAAYKQAKPVSHMEVSAAYRKRLVRTLAADALNNLSASQSH